MEYVTSVEIENFRGIEGPLSVDFRASSGRSAPRPFLLLGSNGSGKSSICEAIEFALKGSVSRRYFNGQKDRRELRNLIAGGAPRASVSLSDGDVVRRGKGSGVGRAEPHPDFSVAPIIVRRKSVEMFWAAAEGRRLEIFWDYFKPASGEWRSLAEQDDLEAYRSAQEYLRKDYDDLKVFAKRVLGFDIKSQPRKKGAFESLFRLLERRLSSKHSQKDERHELDRLISNTSWSLEEVERCRARGVQAESKPEMDYLRLHRVVADSQQHLGELFRSVADIPWLDRVELEPFGQAGLRIRLVLEGGEKVQPADILSEAYLDLLALIVLVEVQKASVAEGQSKVMILDDVFQSVDAPLRQSAMRALVCDLAGWQLIVTMHDRMWSDILARICLEETKVKPDVVELRREESAGTPALLQVTTGIMRDAKFVLDSGGSPVLLMGAVGRALEAIADMLTVSLRCSVRRRPQGKYTIGDLLPPLLKEFQTNARGDIRAAGAALEYAQFNRNLFGAHFNEEGDTVTIEEAVEVYRAVDALHAAAFCSRCDRPMGRRGVSAEEVQGVAGNSLNRPWVFQCEKHPVAEAATAS